MPGDHRPPERSETLRNALREALRARPLTLRELSAEVSASERDLHQHLEHLARSLALTAERLRVEPARCLACGFSFEERTRLTKPSRCPQCRATRISQPRFEIVPV